MKWSIKIVRQFEVVFDLSGKTFKGFKEGTKNKKPLPSQCFYKGQGLLIIEALQSYSDKPHSVGILWTSEQLVAETLT
jgi:hypothetical protein